MKSEEQRMTTHDLPRGMIRATSAAGTQSGYMPGFGNDFETEALPDALPQGQNSPQKCNYGLYAEQLSGTAFTAPRGQNERTWCYRIRPSVHHTGRFTPIDVPHWKTAPNVLPNVTSLGQYRWDPIPVPDEDLTWITGMRTITTAGDVNIQVGMASHVYLVTRSMVDEYFFSADSELLVVPQEGRLRFCTELGVIDLEPKEIAILPRGLVYRVEVLEGSSARTTARSSTCPAVARSARTAWPTRATSSRPSPPSRTAKCQAASSSSGVASFTSRASATRRWTSSPGTAIIAPTSTTCGPIRRWARSSSTIPTRRSSRC
jgi:homogentisate 1,2-dioxygenase